LNKYEEEFCKVFEKSNEGEFRGKMTNKPKEVGITIHKIYAEDGLELDALLFEPKKKNPRGIVIHIHGKEGHFIQNHFVTVMGYTYPLYGYSFLTFNNRGHDYLADMLRKSTQGYEWVTKGTAYDLIEECVYDIGGVVSYVRDLGYKKIILQGHSIGPHKIVYYLAKRPKHGIEKVILLSSGDVRYLLDAYVKGWKDYIPLAEKLIKKGKGDELMPVRLWSNALVSAKTFWHYTKEDSDEWIFNFSHPELGFKYFDKIKLPILAVSPENDIAIGVKSAKAMQLIKERTISQDFKSLIIKNTVHNYAGKEEELALGVMKWLESSS